jgi:hypothetical protein
MKRKREIEDRSFRLCEEKGEFGGPRNESYVSNKVP